MLSESKHVIGDGDVMMLTEVSDELSGRAAHAEGGHGMTDGGNIMWPALGRAGRRVKQFFYVQRERRMCLLSFFV